MPEAAERPTNVAQSRLTKVFKFLKALNELRNPVPRDLSAYAQILWIDKWPVHPTIIVQRGDREEREDDADVDVEMEPTIRVQRPWLTPCPNPPNVLADWLKPTWQSVDAEVEVLESRNFISKDKATVTVRFADNSERVEALNVWSATRERWAAAERPAIVARQLFERVHELWTTMQREGDRVELVLAEGMLCEETQLVRHPILLQRINFEFDPAVPEFRFSTGTEKVELHRALLRLLPTIDARMIAHFDKELEAHPVEPLGGESTTGFLRSLIQGLFTDGEFLNEKPTGAIPGHPTTWTHIGIGVHPDVHALEYSNNGARLWCGCDGGVFRSDRPTSPAGFYARNDGFSISESNFVAGHPRCEGNFVVGLQDNGVVERLSTGVWQERFEGDGGGVARNPLDPTHFLAQYVQGDWYNAPGPGTGPVFRAGALTAESGNAAFYSMPACIAHVRTPTGGGAAVPISQSLIGTQRPWYSDNFGATWVTLPTGNDPLPGDTSVQDDLGSPITVCRWQSPDVAWLLFTHRIVRLSRTPGSHNGGGAGTWAAPEDVAPPGYHPSGKEKKRPPAPPSLLDSTVWTDIAPNLDAGGAQRGTKGALYIGTIGHETKPGVDTLWWFDGTDQWCATGLRAAVPAPVLAIAYDSTTPDEVWVGTTVGVWHGQRAFPTPTTPHWDWTQRVNGLAEAAVEDLQVFRDGGLVLLRAAVAARGIWELRLDTTDVPDLTYLRAHEDDLRHRAGGATEVRRDLSTASSRSWHGSPDVRPREAPRAIAAPSTLPWRRDHRFANTTEMLRRFQAAMRSHTNDPRIVANAQWDVCFSEVLRNNGAPTLHVAAAPPVPALDKVQITTAVWNSHMTGVHATAEPWGAGPPSEADLYQLTPTLDQGVVGQASCTLPRRALKVDIVVHYRGANAVDGANVRVTLLRWTKRRRPHDAHWEDATTWPTGNVPWTDAVNQALNSADGKTALALGADWQFVLGSGAGDSRRLDLTGQTLDMMRAGIATFDFPTSLFATPSANTVVLLVAVTRAGSDIALAPASLHDLALTSPNVAVRSLRVGP